MAEVRDKTAHSRLKAWTHCGCSPEDIMKIYIFIHIITLKY